MKNSMPFISVLAGLAASCAPAGEQSKVEPGLSGVAEERFDEASTKTQAAAAMWEYAYAEKAEFVDEMKRELAGIQADLVRLSNEAKSSGDAVEAGAKVRLDAVRGKWNESKRQLDLAENATESTWSDVQIGFNKRYAELKGSFDEARRWLSDGIEP